VPSRQWLIIIGSVYTKPSTSNPDPAAVHEHEVRVPDQPEMVRAESLDDVSAPPPGDSEHRGPGGGANRRRPPSLN
jgi:hypothetical protein